MDNRLIYDVDNEQDQARILHLLSHPENLPTTEERGEKYRRMIKQLMGDQKPYTQSELSTSVNDPVVAYHAHQDWERRIKG